MGRIHLLTDAVANQVAAGEVVERPASVLKELVENSIDAGAKKIAVAFDRGGIELLRVTDDGSGMDRSDALLSLERHATSKMRTIEDLSLLTSLGFRGEALPSIASVSRFRLITRQRDMEAESLPGTEIQVEGGRVIEVKESADTYGTKIEVKNLFYNVPARRKFLKGEQTEAAHLIAQLQSLAVAHPEIAWSCLRDGKELFRLAANESLAMRLSNLYGSAFLKRMRELPPLEVEEIVVRGFFARPGEGRSDRSHQLFFVNGRMIRSPLLSQALREACDGILPKGLHPPAVLFFELDPGKVDCNVHPAKREVRFQEPVKIRAAAVQAAKSVIGSLEQVARIAAPSLQEIARSYRIKRQGDDSLFSSSSSIIEESANRDLAFQKGGVEEQTEEERSEAIPFRYIGSFLSQRYLLLEENDGLVVLEVPAALERITYERLHQMLLGGSLQRQSLLLPQVVELSAAESAWIVAHQELLEKAGVEVELFSEARGESHSQSLKVDALPLIAAEVPVATLLQQLVQDFQEEESKSSLKKEGRMLANEEILARSVSGMVAQAKKLPEGEMAAVMLVRDLLRCRLPYATPSGKPTMIQLSESELRRKFRAMG